MFNQFCGSSADAHPCEIKLEGQTNMLNNLVTNVYQLSGWTANKPLEHSSTSLAELKSLFQKITTTRKLSILFKSLEFYCTLYSELFTQMNCFDRGIFKYRFE